MMKRDISLILLFIAAMYQQIASASSGINVQLVPAFLNAGCKDVVIYNNTNHVFEVTVDYVYQASDGSHYSSSHSMITVNPGTNYKGYLWPFNVKCELNPDARVTNVRTVDKTIEAERAAAAYQRQEQIRADGLRKFLEQRQRENEKREAERKKQQEEFLRQKEVRLEKERKERERAIERARNQPGIDLGCPPRQICKPLHLPPPPNNTDWRASAQEYEHRINFEKAREAAAAAEAQRQRDAARKTAERIQEERRQAEHAAQVRAWDEERQRRHSMGCTEADAEMRQAPERIRQLEAQGTQKGAHGAAQLKEWLAALQARCGAPQTQMQAVAPRAPISAPQYQAAPMQTQSYQPPVAQTAPANDPCEHTRKAYENDPKNLAKAYLLKRCVKKNRQAVQVQ